jgi:HK97 family phage prohead protease
MERKSPAQTTSIKAGPKGEIEAVFATYNVKDHDGDWTLPGAFEDGAQIPISAYGHQSWSGALPVGKGTIRTTAKDARIDGQLFLNTDAGRETFTMLKELGELAQFSYGYDVLKTGELTEELRQRGIRRVLKKLKVHEVSPVLVGAGIDTRLVAAKGDAGAAATAGGMREELERIRRENDARRKRLLASLKDYEISPLGVRDSILDAAEWAAKFTAKACGFKTPAIRWYSADAPGTTRGFASVGDFREIWLRETDSVNDVLEACGHEVAHVLGKDSEAQAGEIGRLAVKAYYLAPQERPTLRLDGYAR